MRWINGWDKELGGFYDEGYYFKNKPGITIITNSKNWWAQAEAMNTLLLMADRFPNDPLNYYDKFLEQWNYINTYLIDHKYGGWYDAGLDKSPASKTALKGQIWKGCLPRFQVDGQLHSTFKIERITAGRISENLQSTIHKQQNYFAAGYQFLNLTSILLSPRFTSLLNSLVSCPR